MPISGINNAAPDYSVPAQGPKSEDKRNALGKDDFLNLFIKSLQFQDPMSPMENSEMMQQMAQLGMMEAVTNMQETVNKLSETMVGGQIQQGASLLGKTVTGVDGSGQVVTGTTTKIGLNDGILTLLVNNKVVEIGNVLNVSLPSSEA